MPLASVTARMGPDIGFVPPFVGLAIGIVIMVAGMFMNGLNPVSYAGMAIMAISIFALIYAAVNVPEPEGGAH